jgi:glycosyltransferase involved in cell wall biosynthesis
VTAVRAVVAQIGSREHFLIPRALHRRGALVRLLTARYAPFGGGFADRLAQSRWKPVARVFAARHDELQRNLVTTLTLWDVAQRVWGPFRREWRSHYQSSILAGTAFARRVARLRLPAHNVLIAYSYAALELVEAERARGVFTVVDQIDPAQVEYEMVREEARRWPDFAMPPEEAPTEYFGRVRAEWDRAHLVVVNSEWTREALLSQGVPAEKLEVMPLAYEPPVPLPRPSMPPFRPLQVLWVGSANIRKGIHYLLQAAEMLQHEPLEITVAGTIGIRPERVRKAPGNIRWLGPVPRGRVDALYRSHHVFVLPTLSDGFAITQLEALAIGLPVIVTPNCGRVVHDGETGFVIPPRDASALADAIKRFVRDPTLVSYMAPRCIAAAQKYTVDTYARRLLRIIERRMMACPDLSAVT